MSDAAKTRIVMRSPVAISNETVANVSPRLASLEGKVVGFLFNGHYMANVYFDAMSKRLTQKIPFGDVVSKIKHNVGAPSPLDVIKEMGKKCDMAVVGVGA